MLMTAHKDACSEIITDDGQTVLTSATVHLCFSSTANPSLLGRSLLVPLLLTYATYVWMTRLRRPLHAGTFAAMDVAVIWEEELFSVDATPLSFFSSSSSSHCTPLSSVCRRGELLGGGDRGGGGDGRSSSSSAASFTFTTASRRRSMACGSAGRMNWKHSWEAQGHGERQWWQDAAAFR